MVLLRADGPQHSSGLVVIYINKQVKSCVGGGGPEKPRLPIKTASRPRDGKALDACVSSAAVRTVPEEIVNKHKSADFYRVPSPPSAGRLRDRRRSSDQKVEANESGHQPSTARQWEISILVPNAASRHISLRTKCAAATHRLPARGEGAPHYVPFQLHWKQKAEAHYL